MPQLTARELLVHDLDLMLQQMTAEMASRCEAVVDARRDRDTLMLDLHVTHGRTHTALAALTGLSLTGVASALVRASQYYRPQLPL